jgi:hypothetical protein
VVAAGLFGASLQTWRLGHRDWSWSVLGGTLALLAFPGLGMLAMVVGFSLAHARLPRAPLLRRVVDATEVEGRRIGAVGRAEELEGALLDELEIEPVVDVLREDDPELKRAAIEVIAKQGDTSAVRLLTGLLHDPSPEARFFASLGLSKLEDAICRALLAAQRAVADAPGSSEVHERLAQGYLDYALSGFLEGVTREYYLDVARQEFEAALPSSSDPDGVQRRLARVHLLLGHIVEAAALLDGLVLRHSADPELHLLRMEVIYQFGDLRELMIYASRALAASAGEQGEALAV